MPDPNPISSAELRHARTRLDRAQADHDEAHREWAGLVAWQSRLARGVELAERVQAARAFCDRTTTRPGGLVIAVAVGGGLSLIVASLLPLPWPIRLALAAIGMLASSAVGASLLVPADDVLAARLLGWRQALARLPVPIEESRARLDQVRAARDEALAHFQMVDAQFHGKRGKLKEIDPDRLAEVDFPRFVGAIFSCQGYAVDLTPAASGVDLIAARSGRRLAVRALRHTLPIGEAPIEQARAAADQSGCGLAVVVTNSVFSTAARQAADRLKCRLVAGQEIRGLIDGEIDL